MMKTRKLKKSEIELCREIIEEYEANKKDTSWPNRLNKEKGFALRLTNRQNFDLAIKSIETGQSRSVFARSYIEDGLRGQKLSEYELIEFMRNFIKLFSENEIQSGKEYSISFEINPLRMTKNTISHTKSADQSR